MLLYKQRILIRCSFISLNETWATAELRVNSHRWGSDRLSWLLNQWGTWCVNRTLCHHQRVTWPWSIFHNRKISNRRCHLILRGASIKHTHLLVVIHILDRRGCLWKTLLHKIMHWSILLLVNHCQLNQVIDGFFGIFLLLLKVFPFLIFSFGVPKTNLAGGNLFLNGWSEVVFNTEKLSQLLYVATVVHHACYLPWN